MIKSLLIILVSSLSLGPAFCHSIGFAASDASQCLAAQSWLRTNEAKEASHVLFSKSNGVETNEITPTHSLEIDDPHQLASFALAGVEGSSGDGIGHISPYHSLEVESTAEHWPDTLRTRTPPIQEMAYATDVLLRMESFELVSVGWQTQIRAWDSKTGEELLFRRGSWHGQSNGFKVNPSARTIAVHQIDPKAQSEITVRVYEHTPLKGMPSANTIQMKDLTAYGLSDYGFYLVAVNKQGIIKTFDTRTGREAVPPLHYSNRFLHDLFKHKQDKEEWINTFPQFKRKRTGHIVHIASVPNSNDVILGDTNGILTRLELDTHDIVWIRYYDWWDRDEPTNAPQLIAVSPYHRLSVLYEDSTLRVMHANDGYEEARLKYVGGASALGMPNRSEVTFIRNSLLHVWTWEDSKKPLTYSVRIPSTSQNLAPRIQSSHVAFNPSAISRGGIAGPWNFLVLQDKRLSLYSSYDLKSAETDTPKKMRTHQPGDKLEPVMVIDARVPDMESVEGYPIASSSRTGLTGIHLGEDKIHATTTVLVNRSPKPKINYRLDQLFRSWDLRDGEELRSVRFLSGSNEKAMRSSTDGRTIVLGTSSGDSLKIYRSSQDHMGGRVTSNELVSLPHEPIKAFAPTQDGDTVIMGLESSVAARGLDGLLSVQVMPYASRPLTEIGTGYRGDIQTGVITTVHTFPPPKGYIALGDHNGVVTLLDGPDLIPLWANFFEKDDRSDKENPVKIIAIDPKQEHLAVFFEDQTLRIIDDSGRQAKLLKYPINILAVSFSPDGKYVLFVDQKGTIAAWNWQLSDRLMTAPLDFPLQPDEDRQRSNITILKLVSFSPDATHIAVTKVKTIRNRQSIFIFPVYDNHYGELLFGDGITSGASRPAEDDLPAQAADGLFSKAEPIVSQIAREVGSLISARYTHETSDAENALFVFASDIPLHLLNLPQRDQYLQAQLAEEDTGTHWASPRLLILGPQDYLRNQKVDLKLANTAVHRETQEHLGLDLRLNLFITSDESLPYTRAKGTHHHVAVHTWIADTQSFVEEVPLQRDPSDIYLEILEAAKKAYADQV